MQITPAALNATFFGFNTLFKDAFTAAPTFMDEVAMERPSTGELENYAFLAKLPRFREWVGARVWNNLNAYAQTVFNKTWEDGFEVEREKIEDDQLGIFTPGIQMLGIQAKQLWDDLLVGALESGTSTIIYDGQAYLSANHPVYPGKPGSAVQSNYYAATALTAANYRTVRQNMKGLLGDDGHPLGIDPKILMVPTQLEGAGKDIVQADRLASGASNTDYQTTRLVVNPKLTSATRWYLFDNSLPIKPLLKQVRRAPSFYALTEAFMENVVNLRKYRYGSDARGNAALGLWQMCAAGN